MPPPARPSRRRPLSRSRRRRPPSSSRPPRRALGPPAPCGVSAWAPPRGEATRAASTATLISRWASSRRPSEPTLAVASAPATPRPRRLAGRTRRGRCGGCRSASASTSASRPGRARSSRAWAPGSTSSSCPSAARARRAAPTPPPRPTLPWDTRSPLTGPLYLRLLSRVALAVPYVFKALEVPQVWGTPRVFGEVGVELGFAFP